MLFKTTEKIILDVATRFKKIRKVKGITQLDLSKMSNVSYGTIKRFETTGEISLHSLVMLCQALGIENEITKLFETIPFTDISELIKYGK